MFVSEVGELIMIPHQIVTRVIDMIDPEKLIRMTADLVAINSVWDPAAGTSEKEAAEYVLSWATDHGFDAKMEEVAPGRPNVIISCPFDFPSYHVMITTCPFARATTIVCPA